MPGSPSHYRPAHFPIVQDCLQIGGIKVTELADRIGRTPFYAYDRRVVTERVEFLRTSLPPGVRLYYAIKANPMLALVCHLAGLVDGFDVASVGELHFALNAGSNPASISFAGPGKSERELGAAIASGVTISLESEGEMERVAALSRRVPSRPRVLVRVNPNFELKGSGMKMSGSAAPFGVDEERVPTMLERLGKLELQFDGFHIYSGSQNLRAESIIEVQGRTVELAIALAEHAPSPVRTLNIGGGFGIPYFPGEKPLDLFPIGENLARLMVRMQKHLPEAQLVIELGRYLVGEAGVYVCRVLERKQSRKEIFLITDGGLHHHLAASGNFGQVIRKNFPVVVGNRVQGGEREIINVVGPLCTPLDILARHMELSRAEPGDLVVVLQSGAYGLSASPTGFLSHEPPAEVLV